jgi:hypothetical protein
VTCARCELAAEGAVLCEPKMMGLRQLGAKQFTSAEYAITKPATVILKNQPLRVKAGYHPKSHVVTTRDIT